MNSCFALNDVFRSFHFVFIVKRVSVVQRPRRHSSVQPAWVSL